MSSQPFARNTLKDMYMMGQADMSMDKYASGVKAIEEEDEMDFDGASFGDKDDDGNMSINSDLGKNKKKKGFVTQQAEDNFDSTLERQNPNIDTGANAMDAIFGATAKEQEKRK